MFVYISNISLFTLFSIFVYISISCLFIFSPAAPRSMLTRHLQENPIIERSQSSQVTNDIEREELRNALISGLFLFLKMLRFHEIFATLMLQYFTRNIKHFKRFRLQ